MSIGVFLATLIYCLGAPPGLAQSVFDSGGDGMRFYDAANWNPNGVPASSFTINNGAQVFATRGEDPQDRLQIGATNAKVGVSVGANASGTLSLIEQGLFGQTLDVGVVDGAGTTATGALHLEQLAILTTTTVSVGVTRANGTAIGTLIGDSIGVQTLNVGRADGGGSA
ncbi:MAG TPA: hypothetical protein VG095_09390 [Chthoniobacterales bacterium]|nr:hypothetical protein [Chthoniobacterales bacterium]